MNAQIVDQAAHDLCGSNFAGGQMDSSKGNTLRCAIHVQMGPDDAAITLGMPMVGEQHVPTGGMNRVDVPDCTYFPFVPGCTDRDRLVLVTKGQVETMRPSKG